MAEQTINDGFDLIEYPCVFKFKAVCKSSPEIEEKLHALVAKTLSAKAIKSIQQRESKKGSFVSLTLEAELKSRDELETVYAVLKSDENVIMTL